MAPPLTTNMATSPNLVDVDGELHLDVSVGQTGRTQFALTERATALLVDDLEYGNRDVVPWVTTWTLVLTGGAYLRDERADTRETAWSITGADGGREATDEELRRVGEYLDGLRHADLGGWFPHLTAVFRDRRVLFGRDAKLVFEQPFVDEVTN